MNNHSPLTARSFCLLLAIATLVPIAFVPIADAAGYVWRCRGENTTWDSSTVTWRPTTGSFPIGSAWRGSLETASFAWNNQTPSSRFRFAFSYVGGNTYTAGDGINNILVTNSYTWGTGTLAVTLLRRNKGCPIWPLSRPKLSEADILFNPAFTWENATNPALPLPFNPITLRYDRFNSTIVALHEMGHAFGLAHENNVMGTMDEFYPDGGPIGNANEVHPHADDVAGNLSGYAWQPLFGPWQRDVVASAFRRTGAGTSEEIPAPASVGRGVVRSWPFTVENRSLYDQNGVRVQFYLSTNRWISTGDTFLGSTTLNMPSMFTGTLTANLTIPASVTPGQYFFGYIVDANSQIAEFDEGNNAVGYARRTTVTNANIPPTACFTVTPSSGPSPLFVSMNASCSSDPDGSIVSYNWTTGDGGSRTGQTTSWFYDTNGVYTITLTVRDDDGATRSTTRSVVVFGGDCGFDDICLEEDLDEP